MSRVRTPEQVAALREHNWRCAGEAMAAVLATMDNLLWEQEPVNLAQHDSLVSAKATLAAMTDMWESELNMMVWMRLVVQP